MTIAEAIAQDQVEIEAELAQLRRDLEAKVGELERKHRAATKAEAGSTYENTAYTPKSERVHAKDGIELDLETIRVSESALSPRT